MPAGEIYDVEVTLIGAEEHEMRIYSSQPAASVVPIGGRKYRITGLAEGETFIMFEVWRNGKLLTHASTKITVQEGVRPHGEKNYAASIFTV